MTVSVLTYPVKKIVLGNEKIIEMDQQFLEQNAFLIYSWRFFRSNILETIIIKIGNNSSILETQGKSENVCAY